MDIRSFRFQRHGAALLAAALLLATPAPAGARVPGTIAPPPLPVDLDRVEGRQLSSMPPLRWNPEWPRFRLSEYVVTGAALSTALTAIIIGRRDTTMTSKVTVDESVRDTMRIGDRDLRWFTRDLSDVLLTTMIAYPYLVDALVVAGWYRDSLDVAWQMTLINAEVMGITIGVQSLVKMLVSRERPYGRTCGVELDEHDRDCDSSDRYQSHFSGHTAMSFAAAGLICSHHMNLKLYGGGAPDIIPCVASFTMAAGVGVLRITGDKHYFTDVLVGAAVGTLAGLGLPWLLHYRYGPSAGDAAGERGGVSLQVVPMGGGAGVVGTF